MYLSTKRVWLSDSERWEHGEAREKQRYQHEVRECHLASDSLNACPSPPDHSPSGLVVSDDESSNDEFVDTNPSLLPDSGSEGDDVWYADHPSLQEEIQPLLVVES
mmetsp:Transcript_25540/g.53353  ORF Transcript_25540/g.53353 Transcript_25540/m.53353 type:complete len:106 (+) Transcript_25540:450-767(+)